MYKTLLDHRFSSEYQQLLHTRAALIDHIVDEAQQQNPARSARAGFRLVNVGLQGDTHPLQAEWMRLDPARACPIMVAADALTPTLYNRIKTYVALANEHVENRKRAKQLISELEAAVWRRSLAHEWKEGAFALTHRPIADIIQDLNTILQL